MGGLCKQCWEGDVVTENGGTATITSGPAPSLRADGPCLMGTLALPMPPAAIDKIRSDALDLLSRIVTVYSAEIALGEVGADGSGKAAVSVPQKPCTALL